MGVKVCRSCAVEKPTTAFNKNTSRKIGIQSECRVCQTKRNKTYRDTHRAQCAKYSKHYQKNNRKSVNDKSKAWRKKNLARARDRDTRYRVKYAEQRKVQWRNWYVKNYVSVRARMKDRLQQDSVYRLKHVIRTLIRQSFQRKGLVKSLRSEAVLGMPITYVAKYLEETAINTYGSYSPEAAYHIDHIVPLKEAKTADEVIKLCHYTNLQLLTPNDNLRKSSKLDWTYSDPSSSE